jgi:hypothetical protein
LDYGNVLVTRLGAALREKFPDAKSALLAMGLDASLLTTETSMTAKPTRLAATLLALTASHLKPVLAKDAKIDLMPIFKDVTRKNFNAKNITMALDSALKGKLAKDASMKHVTDMLDALEPELKEEVKDESASDPQQKAMEAAAAGNSDLGIPQKVGDEDDDDATFDAEPFKAFLKEKGVGDADIAKACDMVRDAKMPKNALDADETEEEKAAREAKENAAKDEAIKAEADKKAAADKAAKDAEMKDMVSKGAMDAALQAHGKAVEQRVIERQKAVRDAERTVKPWVGELANSMSFDSAEQVFRAALDVLGIDHKKVSDAGALPVILNLAPKPGARPAQRNELALDAAAGGFAERHPEAARINSI